MLSKFERFAFVFHLMGWLHFLKNGCSLFFTAQSVGEHFFWIPLKNPVDSPILKIFFLTSNFWSLIFFYFEFVCKCLCNSQNGSMQILILNILHSLNFCRHVVGLMVRTVAWWPRGPGFIYSLYSCFMIQLFSAPELRKINLMLQYEDLMCCRRGISGL